MSRSRRLEEKRRRREKRLDRRRDRSQESNDSDPFFRVARLLKAIDVPPPATWPGASDAKLDRPDLLKYEVGTFAATTGPGKTKLKQFERDVCYGPLSQIPDIEHWAMEEFFWHGVPGDLWHPIDAFLAGQAEVFSPAAQEQIRRWKEARFGLFEVGAVSDDTVTLWEWDPTSGMQAGPRFSAISLNLGGVNAYRELAGQVTATYVSPWSPTENLFCAMGYGVTVEKRKAVPLALLLGLRHPELAARPLPWRAGHTSAEYLVQWRSREWYGWLRDRLHFPFQALVAMPPLGRPAIKAVQDLVPETPEQARRFGIYFEVPSGREVVVAGATALTPLDIGSPNFLPIAEYHAYRARVGPPPGARGQPTFMEL